MTVIALPLVDTEAEPAATLPPVGNCAQAEFHTAPAMRIGAIPSNLANKRLMRRCAGRKIIFSLRERWMMMGLAAVVGMTASQCGMLTHKSYCETKPQGMTKVRLGRDLSGNEIGVMR